MSRSSLPPLVALWVVIVGCGAVLVACKGGASETEKQQAKEPEKAPRESGVELREVSDADWGYRIQVPVAATQTEKTEYRQVWAWVYNDQVDSYTAMIEEQTGIDTKEQARARVALVRAVDSITDVRELDGGGFVVVMAEDEYVHYGEVWVFRKGAKHQLLAICAGPARGDTPMRMCSSLEVD